VSDSSIIQQSFRWLATHAGPANRLPSHAELLVLIAAAAAMEESGGNDNSARGPGASNTFNAQLRSYTIQRRRVHVKCDNSAKV
jgi:hypothetical protein